MAGGYWYLGKKPYYFNIIMLLIILAILSAMGVLSEGLICRGQNYNRQAVSFNMQQWTTMLPFLFKGLLVVNFLEFKVHIWYLNKC